MLAVMFRLLSHSEMASKAGRSTVQRLEHQLDLELASIKDDPKLDTFSRRDRQLSVYSACMQSVITYSRTLGKLLARIRCGYEDFIRKQRFAIQGLRIKVQKLQKELEEAMTPAEELVAVDNSMEPHLRSATRIQLALMTRDKLAREKEQLEMVVKELKSQIKEQEAKNEESKDVLMQEYKGLREAFERLRREQEEQEDPITLRMALDQCRRDLGKTINELDDFRTDFKDVVPQSKLDASVSVVRELELEKEILLRRERQLRRENQGLRNRMQEQQMRIDSLVERKRFVFDNADDDHEESLGDDQKHVDSDHGRPERKEGQGGAKIRRWKSVVRTVPKL